MGLMCMVCDAAVPAAEETRNARWTIPVAVVLTCVIVGLWYVLGFSAFSMARSAQDVVGSTIQNDVAPMVNRVWGRMKFLVSLTAMTASLGAFIPIMIGSSRMLYAMAREEKLPRAIAALHGKFQSPWNALHVLFAFTILGTIPAVFLFGTDNTINWWGFTLGWYIAVVYLTANLVNIVYYWRFARARFNPILNALIPAAAIAVQLVFLWQTVIVELWQNGALGRSAQAYIALMSVMTLIYVILIRSRPNDRANGFQVVMGAKETA
jgi:amino acid transporter